MNAPASPLFATENFFRDSLRNLLEEPAPNADRESGDGTMEQSEKFELLTWRKEKIAPALSFHERAIDLPGVPVLAETLLKMELELHESATDLRGFSEAVLEDLGATIQVLRFAGREYGAATDRPVRVQDCISALGPRECLNAAAKGSLLRGNRQQASVAMWAHSREVAQYFSLFAAQASGSISPDQAYLAGLLHALGALPAILGWGRYGVSGDPSSIALEIADQWRLPFYLKEFFTEVAMPGRCPQWSKFITVAHHPAKESWVECPLRAKPLPAFS